MNTSNLEGIFEPKSIAVIGASSTEGKIGNTVLKNLVESGYKGAIYPINPKATEIFGLKVYAEIDSVPGPVDAAIVTVPASLVIQETEQLGKKGVKGLAVITSGFSEVGNRDLEKQLVETAHKYGMRVLGPNIVGVLSNSAKMNASFAPFLPYEGKATLISQSGALLIALDASSYVRRVGFDKLISIGNMSDIDFADIITYLNDDPKTTCSTLYIEGIKDGRAFLEAAQKSTKPIVALKAGVSAHGAAAAASHTGSLAGAAKIYGAAFQQAGVVQAKDLNNLFDRTQTLSLQPPMKGDNVVIITNGGGVGVLATDSAEKCGIPLKFAPEDVQTELKKHMPAFGSAKNPVDLTGMAGYDWYYPSVKFTYAHDWTDGLVVLYCETAITQPMDIARGIKQAVDDSGVKGKPITVSFVGGEKSEEAMRWLVENGIPAFGAPDIAIDSMAALHEYAKMRNNLAVEHKSTAKGDEKLSREIIAAARADGRGSLTEIEAKQVFAAYGMPVTSTKLAKDEEHAVKLAKEVGFPIVMKIVSPEILHKSDAGGVKVNIKDEQGVRDAYQLILKNAKAYNADANIHGVAIQEMAEWGTEVILGSVNDPTFGPTMMFGLGGIFVEVLKDVTFRVAPVPESQAMDMFSEIKAAPILSGVRGESARDKAALAKVINQYSTMIMDLADEISESDANPVLVYPDGKGVKVVDARIILKKKA